ncbi:MAG: AAA family ATPase [Pseudomonadales bacterium]
MSQLELRFLGDLEVIRDGGVLKLPPSKKTRALLAYLALHDRAFRREHLCELLWEIPDDPRGSLRWSLSKLRRLVDEDDAPRILADRNTVRLRTDGLGIDVLALKQAAAAPGDTPLEQLEAQALGYRGTFLEGLELSGFHDFHAWCVAEREACVRAQTALLEALVGRLADEPERALPHARSLAGLAPYDEAVRARLIRLLVRTQRSDEADQQVQLGERLLREAGVTPSGALNAARRGSARGGPPSGASARTTATAPAMAEMASRPGPDAPASPSLVGREAECGQLRTHFDRVLAGGTLRCVLLKGEPGIGKSRLLEWFAELASSAGAVVLEATTFESESLRPYALWIDALRSLGVADAVFRGTDSDRDGLFAALSEYLLAATEGRTPVIVAFDDVQWADESSMAALHYVSRLCRRAPVCMVLAAREGELQDNAPLQQTLRALRQSDLLEEIRVGPLADGAIRELLAARAPESDVEAIGRECGGNPLLAIELARRMGSEESGTLDELVAERLSRLNVDDAEVIRWAAVLSPRIDLETLVRVTGQAANQVGASLERAERSAMLRAGEGGFRFSHELIARGVYTGIAPARRQVMHRRAAELIEQEAALDLEHAADLAHHALASDDPGLGARALVSAGRLCLRFFANDHALVLARRGLQLARKLTGAEQVCRRIELFDVMLTAAPVYDWEAAAREYVTLAEQALDHGELAHARLGYHMASTVRWAHGHWAGAREESLQAELITRGAGEEEHVLGLAETAKCLAMLERDLNRADAMVMEARALAERSRIGYSSALPAAEGILRYHENEMDAAEALLKEARTLCKSAGDRLGEYQANEYLVMVDVERGRFDAARRRADTLVELGDKVREGSEAPFAHALRALCDYLPDGETTTDPADLDGCLDALRALDAKHRLAYVLNRMAERELEAGQVALAQAHATEACECAGVLERASEMIIALGTLQRVAALNGEEEALNRHRQAIDALAGGRIAPWALERAGRRQEAA